VWGKFRRDGEVLEWVAVELGEEWGWSFKKLHKLIVTSATYRQSSAVHKDLTAKDPRNLLLGRQSRLRLEAELIRDAALCASGLPNPKVGGPGAFPPPPRAALPFRPGKHPGVADHSRDLLH